MFKHIKEMGLGVVVAAAFIGPGTVTACTLADSNYRYTPIRALLFATLATIVLQEMSARPGTIKQLSINLID